MYEILRCLPAGSRVLDLGCARGSFGGPTGVFDHLHFDRITGQDQAGQTRFGSPRSRSDAFTVSRQLLEERTIQGSVTLHEAQVSIALAAVSGGMFEIGDDLPTLGSDPERVALVRNPDLLAMAKLGRAALPLDLLTYADKDEQPSVFLLREDQRQSMLAVFNWTEQPSFRTFTFSDLKLPAGHSYQLFDSLAQDQPLQNIA